MADEEYGFDFESVIEESLKPLKNKKIKARVLDKRIKERIDEIAEFISERILEETAEELKKGRPISISLVIDIKLGLEEWEKTKEVQITNLIDNRGEKATLYWLIFRKVIQRLAKNKVEYSLYPSNISEENLSLKKEGRVEVPDWIVSQREIPYLFLRQFYKLEALVDPERDPEAGEDLEEFESIMDLRELEFKTLGLSKWIFNTKENIPPLLTDTLKRWEEGSFKNEREREIAEETSIIFYGTANVEGYGAFDMCNEDIEEISVLWGNKCIYFEPEEWVACRKDKVDELLKFLKKEHYEI